MERPPVPFAHVVELSSEGPLQFVGPPSPEWSGRTYGGQLLAQGLVAAARTVAADRPAHSLHASFLRAGEATEPTHHQVEVVRDGRSFASRQVVGSQDGRELVRMVASFQAPEDGPIYQDGGRFDLDGLAGPDEAPLTYNQFHHIQAGTRPGSWPGEARTMDIRYLDPPPATRGGPIVAPQLMWMRVNGPVGEDPTVHQAALAYLADGTLIDHVALPHGRRWQDDDLRGASLDHAMWFHRPSPGGDWLLYVQRVEATGGGRGLASGRIYDADGRLVATCIQEGLMRLR